MGCFGTSIPSSYSVHTSQPLGFVTGGWQCSSARQYLHCFVKHKIWICLLLLPLSPALKFDKNNLSDRTRLEKYQDHWLAVLPYVRQRVHVGNYVKGLSLGLVTA